MLHVRVKTGRNKGRIFKIANEVLTIGRDDNQTIQVFDEGVSRQHSEIFRIGEMVFVRDLQSTNGTFVNDEKVTEESLKEGDELLIGTTIFRFEEDEKEGGGGVEYVEEKEERPLTTVVEVKVDTATRAKKPALGREIESQNLSLTYEIGQKLHSGKDFGVILQEVLDRMGESIKADGGYVLLVKEKTGKLIKKAETAGGAGLEKKVSRTIVKHVLATGRPVLTSDAALDQRFSLSESVVIKKIGSVICAPILVKERVAGLLYFHSSKMDGTFQIADLELAASGALQLTTLLMMSKQSSQLRKGMLSTIRALVTAIEIIDPKSQGHAERVADYGTAIAAQLGLPRSEVHKVRLAALLHDVGKLAAHHSVQGLEKEQQKEQHVFSGEKILSTIEGFREILPGIRYHHERADGSGFPYKLTNDKIPMMARVIIVANAFDNECTLGGIGAQGLPTREVLKDLANRGGKDFDDDVVKALLICHRNGTLYTGAKSEQ